MFFWILQQPRRLFWDWQVHRVHSPKPKYHSSGYMAFPHTAPERCSKESRPPEQRESSSCYFTVTLLYVNLMSSLTVYALLLLTRILEMPKSPILTIIWCLSSRIFWVLRSRCRMSLLCTWYRASKICTKKWRMVSSSRRELQRFWMYSARVPPETIQSFFRYI